MVPYIFVCLFGGGNTWWYSEVTLSSELSNQSWHAWKIIKHAGDQIWVGPVQGKCLHAVVTL